MPHADVPVAVEHSLVDEDPVRGHQVVDQGRRPLLPHAVFRSVYAEMNARLEAQAMALGGKITYLSPEEAKLAEASLERTLSRPWELWKRKAMAR